MGGLLATSTATFLLTCIFAMTGQADANPSSQFKHRQRHLIDLFKRQQLLQSGTVPNLDSSKDDTVGKRQEFLFDDYGHMRFGKREESDDYGHLRFGRGGDER